jgi:stage V sporulation protein K
VVENLEQLLEGKSGRFSPTKYARPDGPTGARCSLEYFTSISQTRFLIIEIRGDRFEGAIDIRSLVRWAEMKSRSSVFGTLQVHFMRGGDEWEFCFTVRYSLPLRGLTQSFTIEAMMHMLGMWQEAEEEARKRIDKAQNSRAVRRGTIAANIPATLELLEKTEFRVQAKAAVKPETVLAELDNLVGLHNVKDLVNRLNAQDHVSKLRAAQGLVAVSPSPHLVFTGNPGTGKTTVARLVGRLYKQLGLLSKGHVVEVDRSTLIAPYLGQTALRTKAACEKALGGVLFIDEAYSLDVGGNDYGMEAIETLLTFMEANRGKIVVIVAGYPDEMDKFLDSNPGLRGRFDATIHFDDYSVDEMMQIFENLLTESEYDITDAASLEVRCLLDAVSQREGNSNAREVRTLFNELVAEHATSLMGIQHPTAQQLRLLTTMAIPARCGAIRAIDIADMPPID